MGTLAEIRQGMVTALSAITGLSVTTRFDQTGGNIAIVGLPTRILYDESAGGDTYTIPVKVIVPNTSDGHTAFLSYLAKTGSTSIKATLDASPTLGGKCDSLRVTEMEMAAPDFDALKATLLTADFLVEIFA
jgi:hypothetical protein